MKIIENKYQGVNMQFAIGLGIGIVVGVVVTYLYQYKVISAGKKALSAIETGVSGLRSRL